MTVVEACILHYGKAKKRKKKSNYPALGSLGDRNGDISAGY